MHKYQSLEAWRRAHATLISVMRVTDAAYHPRARPLFDQLRRAAVSIEANVVEGYALGSKPQFARFLRIALGSGAEAECLTRAAVELGYLSPEQGRTIAVELARALKLIYGLWRALRRSIATP